MSVDVHPRGNDTSDAFLSLPPPTARNTLGVQFLRVFLFPDVDAGTQFLPVQLHTARQRQEGDDRSKLGEFQLVLSGRQPGCSSGKTVMGQAAAARL